MKSMYQMLFNQWLLRVIVLSSMKRIWFVANVEAIKSRQRALIQNYLRRAKGRWCRITTQIQRVWLGGGECRKNNPKSKPPVGRYTTWETIPRSKPSLRKRTRTGTPPSLRKITTIRSKTLHAVHSNNRWLKNPTVRRVFRRRYRSRSGGWRWRESVDCIRSSSIWWESM